MSLFRKEALEAASQGPVVRPLWSFFEAHPVASKIVIFLAALGLSLAVLVVAWP